MINFIGSKAQNAHAACNWQSVTGENERDNLKNIYDLESNNHEWTAQTYNNNFRVLRGGSVNGDVWGEFDPASSRSGYDPNITYFYISSRISLYL